MDFISKDTLDYLNLAAQLGGLFQDGSHHRTDVNLATRFHQEVIIKPNCFIALKGHILL
jgi:hypothetical protein